MSKSAPERPLVLVCLSDGPSAEAVLRVGVRLARDLGAELHALHVEPPGANTRRPPGVSQLLAHTLRLAADLGAQVRIIASHQAPQAIAESACRLRATHIVIGPSRRSGWQRLLKGDPVARLRTATTAAVIVTDEALA